MSSQRIRFDEGALLAEEFKVPFFETSAKDNVGVKEAFSTLATLVKNRLLTADGTEETYRVDTIRLTGGGKTEASSCPC